MADADLHVGGVDAARRVDRLVERLDDLAQLRRVAVLQQQVEEGVRVRLLQVGEGTGIRRVPRLVRAGLRHAELVEEHLLELLGRAEVHLAADLGVGAVPRVPAAVSPSSLESAESCVVARR